MIQLLSISTAVYSYFTFTYLLTLLWNDITLSRGDLGKSCPHTENLADC